MIAESPDGQSNAPRHIVDLLEALVATWPAQAQQRLHREVARCADVEAAA